MSLFVNKCHEQSQLNNECKLLTTIYPEPKISAPYSFITNSHHQSHDLSLVVGFVDKKTNKQLSNTSLTL